MREYNREKYKLTEYQSEKYMMEIEDETKISIVHSDNWESLYQKAKEEVEKGKKCIIYEVKFEFKG
jgi:hypothetical protein